MKAIDTSLVVRYIVRDHAEQANAARQALFGGVFVPITVLQETAWVLASYYRQPRSEIAENLLDILDMPNVVVARESAVRWALTQFSTKGDIADLLHIVAAAECDSILTFDRRMVRHAGPDSPIPVELLTS